MNPKSDEFKAAMSDVRQQIQAAKRRGTHGGFIDYHGCVGVTNEFIGMLEDAGVCADHGDYEYAYAVAALILVNCVKLANHADDSAGGITTARHHVDQVLEKVCSGVENGSPAAEYVFMQSVKDSQNKAFDGWEEFAFDLLSKTARLTTVKNKPKIYAALYALHAQASDGTHSNWADEADAIVRLEIIKVTDGPAAAASFIAKNLKYDDVRKVAIRDALATGDFAAAAQLCLDRINSIDRDYYWTREWYRQLFEVYQHSGAVDKQIELAEKLLLQMGDARYYDVVKQLRQGYGTWESNRSQLLDGLGQAMDYRDFQAILANESEWELLLRAVMAHPSSVFEYGKQLAARFPVETYALCLTAIRDQADDANDRAKYRRVCGLIKKLYGFGGKSEAVAVISELRAKCPHRPAMKDELNVLEAQLAKKK